MNDLGKRLDDLAAAASRHAELRDPSLGVPASRPVPRRLLGLSVAALLVMVAMFFFWQGRSDTASLVTSQDPGDETADGSLCASTEDLEALRAGIPTLDYNPAGSYLALHDAAVALVSGRVATVERVDLSGRSFIELSVTDVVDLADRPRPDIEVIAYDAVWADRSLPDPLADPVSLRDVEFAGFLSPWSGVRGGWAPGAEGLYVSCTIGAPLVAVASDAAGPGDPTAPTLTELRTHLSSEISQREAQRRAEEAAVIAEEQARIRAQEQALIEAQAADRLGDIEAADSALYEWLPEPTAIPAELAEILTRGQSTVEMLHELHRHPDVDVFLYQAAGQLCVLAAKVAVDGPQQYGGTSASCASTNDFSRRGLWLSAGGTDDSPAFTIVVPPLVYFDQEWTLEVDSTSGFDTLITARSALVVFDRDAPPETGPATVRCECGDLAYSFTTR